MNKKQTLWYLQEKTEELEQQIRQHQKKLDQIRLALKTIRNEVQAYGTNTNEQMGESGLRQTEPNRQSTDTQNGGGGEDRSN